MSRRNTWTDFLVIVVAVLVIAGVVWLYTNQESHAVSQSGISIATQSVNAKITTQTILPENSPIDCKVRVQSTLNSTTTYVSVHNKPDGVLCEDVCLSSTNPRTCAEGKCAGVCAGQCTKQYEFDSVCPAISVSSILVNNFMVYDYYYQLCMDGICTYYVLFDPSFYTAFSDAHYVDFYSHGSSVSTLAAELCLDFIADSEESKACLVPSFATSTSALQNSASWSVCRFRYDCARAALYAGQSTNNNNFSHKRDVSVERKTYALSGIEVADKLYREILEARHHNVTASVRLQGPATFEQPR